MKIFKDLRENNSIVIYYTSIIIVLTLLNTLISVSIINNKCKGLHIVKYKKGVYVVDNKKVSLYSLKEQLKNDYTFGIGNSPINAIKNYQYRYNEYMKAKKRINNILLNKKE